MRKTVLIADHNAFVRTALYEFFEREPDFQVCAMAENGREADGKQLKKPLGYEVLNSRMLGTATDDDVLEYEIRQGIIHELCNVLAHSAAG